MLPITFPALYPAATAKISLWKTGKVGVKKWWESKEFVLPSVIFDAKYENKGLYQLKLGNWVDQKVL